MYGRRFTRYPIRSLYGLCCGINARSSLTLRISTFLYLGTVYGDIRKPEVLFKLFQKMVEKEPRLRLYVVGKNLAPTRIAI